MNIQEALSKLQNNPKEFFKQAGVNVPDAVASSAASAPSETAAPPSAAHAVSFVPWYAAPETA